MSLPVYCADCMDIVDTQGPLAGFRRGGHSTRKTQCPGKGKHAVFQKEGKEFFGLLEKVRVSLIGGRTTFFNYEYVGPKNDALLLLALMRAYFIGIRVFINGGIVELSFSHGFSGDGYENFKKLFARSA